MNAENKKRLATAILGASIGVGYSLGGGSTPFLENTSNSPKEHQSNLSDAQLAEIADWKRNTVDGHRITFSDNDGNGIPDEIYAGETPDGKIIFIRGIIYTSGTPGIQNLLLISDPDSPDNLLLLQPNNGATNPARWSYSGLDLVGDTLNYVRNDVLTIYPGLEQNEKNLWVVQGDEGGQVIRFDSYGQLFLDQITSRQPLLDYYIIEEKKK